MGVGDGLGDTECLSAAVATGRITTTDVGTRVGLIGSPFSDSTKKHP